MGKGGCPAAGAIDREKPIAWNEIRKHNKKDDAWIVVEKKVYDVTKWKGIHPGGWKVLEDHSGQDASNVFQMYHTEGSHELVRKHMKPLQIGLLSEATFTDPKSAAMEEDFHKLWQMAKEMDLFTPGVFNNIFEYSQIFFFEILCFLTLYYFGSGWVPFLIASAYHGMATMRAGYCMHDLGHRSLFKSSTIDHLIQLYCMGVQGGLSTNFWNEYHSRHHAKPNKHGKDPAINMNEHLYVIGTVMAQEKAKQNKADGKAPVPYHWQHKYWFALGPPIYLPVLFSLVSIKFAFTRRKFDDVIAISLYVAKNLFLYSRFMSIPSCFLLMFLSKQVMSHWFVWVSMSSHMPLPQEYEPVEGYTWFETQVAGSCNLPATYFSDWYTGHVNWQIEHHLFPTMPRENNRYIAPLVKQMAEKYDIPYLVKPSLYQAFYDVYDMFKKSGQEWYIAYNNEYMSVMAGN